MPRLVRLRVTNYRSIKGPIEIVVPEGRPLALVGENNAGKSNIVRAIELMLGESWPGNHEPEDHEFFGRNPDGDPIECRIEVDDVTHSSQYGDQSVNELVWRYPPDEDLQRSLYMVFTNGETSAYVSNATREQCLCLVVAADRRLSYQLSYASKWTWLSKLMRQFHKSLTEQEQTVDDLRERFEEIKQLFLSVPPFARFAEELDRQVEALAGNLAYGLTIDFSAYDPTNYFRALRVLPSESDGIRTFDELGTGQEQILAMAFAHAYAHAFHGGGRTLILVIEEPEAHLHPLAQRWVAQHLRELAATEGIQVIFTTHSPAFVKMLDLEGLVVTRKTKVDGTVVAQLTPEDLADHCRSQGAEQATADTILPFYEAAATEEILSGFFARGIVLVEGPTEAAALPIYLRRVGLDVLKEGIAVIPVLGVGNLAKWFRLFTAYSIPTFVVFDNDASDDANAHRRDDLFRTLEVDERVAQQLLEAETLTVQPSIAAFGRNFEATLGDLFGDSYARLEGDASEDFGLTREGSKPLLARYVAERIELEEGSAAWQQLRALAEAIGHVAPDDPEAKPPEEDADDDDADDVIPF
jgi:putative ATP-dependent endonuclease of the OLD family